MARLFNHSIAVSHGLVGIAAVSVAALACAQQTVPAPRVDAPKSDLAMPQVEVKGATAAYDARRDDTAAKIVINSAELAKYGDASVVDSLKRVPGVTVTSTGRGSDIRMRGLGRGSIHRT